MNTFRHLDCVRGVSLNAFTERYQKLRSATFAVSRTVYMTAGGAKFPRIYYGKVRDALTKQGLWDRPVFEQKPSGQSPPRHYLFR